VPLLVIPPPALVFPKSATLPTKMPSPNFDAILPLLRIQSEKVETWKTSMRPEDDPAEIVPLLLMLPEKAVMLKRSMPECPCPGRLGGLPLDLATSTALPLCLSGSPRCLLPGFA
jgi:hypothetical protein